MKITKIDILKAKSFGGSIWVRIYTDEGIYGDGEAGLAYGAGQHAAFGILQDFAPLLIGADPLDHEVIWTKLYRETFWGQNGGPVIFAGIAAFDIALWDIKGKYFKVPVYKLLGGKHREKLRAYASQLQFGWSETRGPLGGPEAFAEVAKEAVAQGFDSIKANFIAFGPDGGDPARGAGGAWLDNRFQTQLLTPKWADLFIDRVAATREAVGPNVDIIIENHSKTDANGAVQIGKRLEQFNIFYYEEPTTPNPKTFRYIKDEVGIPLASGERIYSRWQYQPYFENSSLQVIQPDIANTGGITEAKKIADAAYAYDVAVQYHVCGSPIIIAATLQLETVIPNFIIHEHHFPKAVSKKYAIYDYQPQDGYIEVPELPGIGNELSEYAFANSDIVTVDKGRR
ncbi:MAG: mandelate racemase/muconate lactonizing enzyme family protein [Lachnospiraceae bacterium]|jgi:L-alanine-DL-glutamate epimerase-like enolase superfamily enzyme|nr:mandelate racemase/muconate lactonizing enzyme family protein [Lachnospiraceae bacterium]